MKRKTINKVIALTVLLLVPVTLSGCTMPSWWQSWKASSNSADTGKFEKVTVIEPDHTKVIYHNAYVFPYNNGGDDSTGGKLEVRHQGIVSVLPDDAEVQLQK